MKPSEAPGWHISLAWRQKLAAYWSISWPALIASYSLVILLTSLYSVGQLAGHFFAIGVVGNAAFFAAQAISTQRLVRKNYRSFRVEVRREDGQRVRRLSIREAGLVWLWILGPQLALLLITSIIVWWYDTLPAQTVQSISSLSLWLRFLLVGPYAVDLAVRAKYPGFQLEAYGYRYI